MLIIAKLFSLYAKGASVKSVTNNAPVFHVCEYLKKNSEEQLNTKKILPTRL